MIELRVGTFKMSFLNNFKHLKSELVIRSGLIRLFSLFLHQNQFSHKARSFRQYFNDLSTFVHTSGLDTFNHQKSKESYEKVTSGCFLFLRKLSKKVQRSFLIINSFYLKITQIFILVRHRGMSGEAFY